MKLVLQLTNSKDRSSQTVVFDQSPVLIGRSRICDVTIHDPVLSRQHCSLDIALDGSVQLNDLNSANGTFLNGERINQHVLSPGQSFQIGGTDVKITRVDLSDEEATLESLVVDKEPSIPGETQIVQPEDIEKPGKKKGMREAKAPPKSELTLKTPTVLRKKGLSSYKTKDWVQVSLLWKGELVDMKCFDRGDVVSIGESPDNDFTVALPSLPAKFEFLKILPTGVEVRLHPAMTGVVETRGMTKQLDELRGSARQTQIGLSTFVQFEDRCLIEMGPFAFYIRSVRLELAAPLTASWIEDPVFIALVCFLAVLMFVGVKIMGTAEVNPEKLAKEQPYIKVENPEVTPPKEPPPPPPPATPKPAPKKQEVKVGKKAQKAIKVEGHEGAGARAKGAEGKSGRTTGHLMARARPIGIVTRKEERMLRSAPKGALGKQKNENLAKRGLRPDQGVGTGKPKPKGTGTQGPSHDIKPKVKVEDEGVLGALNGKGGGGRAANGDVLQGHGLGGTLTGNLEGLERGSDLDAKGAGGRGAKGLGVGGGGSSVEVGGLSTAGKGGGKSGFGLGTSGKKGDADVSYSVEQVEVRDGLTREEIERVVRAHEKEIQACYEKALSQSGNRNLGGRLKVGWFVNDRGAVENVAEISGMSDGGYLFNCVSARIQTWRFPKPRGGKGAQVSWPWVFHKAL